MSSSRSTLLTSTSRKCLLGFGSHSMTITKHLDMCLFLKVGYYSLHHHLVFEQYHLYSCPSLWPHDHPSEVNPKKSLTDECPFTAALLMRNGFSSRTDLAGRAHGKWAARTRSCFVLSTTCLLHHRARVLLSSQKGQNQTGQTHSLYSTSTLPWKIISSQAVEEGENKRITFKCSACRALDWGWCGICPEQCLPSCLVPSDMSLDGDGSLPHAHVLLPHQPASDRLLDADTGSSQLICPYFFQVGYLTSPEKYFCLTKLVLILVLFSKVKRG